MDDWFASRPGEEVEGEGSEDNMDRQSWSPTKLCIFLHAVTGRGGMVGGVTLGVRMYVC